MQRFIKSNFVQLQCVDYDGVMNFSTKAVCFACAQYFPGAEEPLQYPCHYSDVSQSNSATSTGMNHSGYFFLKGIINFKLKMKDKVTLKMLFLTKLQYAIIQYNLNSIFYDMVEYQR